LRPEVPAWCHSSMTDTPPRDASLDRDLNALLDHALTMVVDRLTPAQRAQLRQRADKMGRGLNEHIKRHCSHEVQHALLNQSDTEHFNPDGGRVGHFGEVISEHGRTEDGTTVSEGSGEISAIPTA
jgi:hypothetical protein